MDSLPCSVFSREIQLVKLHGMPKLLYPSELFCISPDEGILPRLGVPGYVAVVLISSEKRWREFDERDGFEGTVVLGPAKRARRCGYVLYMFAVYKEAVIAVARVVFVDETCEKADVGVPFLRGNHCGEAMLRAGRELGGSAVSKRLQQKVS